ncbi:hypothetical protein OG372_37085 [Streptomyces sp. NBC_01020]|uniref:hypothetical protein n=1 Tax=Streptomyces sp. NBC_00144 TaxID=2975665 RepID=UPI0030E0EA89|nr:hypothetical protein OG372_37085 [Streptomyces sp. NBC_01020]WSX71866.1 hypothetical protein OG221_37665 [Streptomyces sp. NBC_00932]
MTADTVLRVHWLPGTDELLGTCHCAATFSSQDPEELWEWLHDHPDHRTPRPSEGPPRDS